jgi:hypothetical protein
VRIRRGMRNASFAKIGAVCRRAAVPGEARMFVMNADGSDRRVLFESATGRLSGLPGRREGTGSRSASATAVELWEGPVPHKCSSSLLTVQAFVG